MISVVIPLYNKEKSIVSTLQSVVDQTYTDWECIVINDGSSDNSLEIVKNYVDGLKIEDRRLKILSKPNGGVCSARNRGIQEAKGEYVALLDGDDIWDKEYLTEQSKMIDDFPDAAMWGINFAETNNGKLVRRLATGLPGGYRWYVHDYFQMPGRRSDLFCSSSVVIKKSVFEEVGYFDERIKYSEDIDMWYRIIATHKVAFYDRYMVFYRFDAENRTLRRTQKLSQSLPYYVGKYQAPMFKANEAFYRWINRWSANHLRIYYFEGNKEDKMAAREAMKNLDYAVIPPKYKKLFGWPYPFAVALNLIDKLYHL